jgi:hypothetical protein
MYFVEHLLLAGCVVYFTNVVYKMRVDTHLCLFIVNKKTYHLIWIWIFLGLTNTNV